MEVTMPRSTFTVLVSTVLALTAAAGAQTNSERRRAPTAHAGPVTVLNQDRVVRLDRTLNDPNDLWVLPQDLPRVNDFHLKPEGACLAELCLPIPPQRDSDIFITRARQGWLNVTAFARRLQQAYVVDKEHAIWSFGDIPVARSAFLE